MEKMEQVKFGEYAIIIIDYLNEYLRPEGKVYCEAARELIPNLRKLIDFAHEMKFPVIYANTSLVSENEPMVKKWGAHSIRGTWGAEIIEELKPTSQDFIVQKRTYDGFYNSELELTIRSLGINKVVITGIHTHVCVLLTAVGAFDRGFEVTTIEDCITTGYKPNHESRLRFFTSHIGELIKLNDFIEKTSRK